MKKFDLGQTIAVLANLGILVSIVFLAIEVSQNQATIEEGNNINLISARATAFSDLSGWRRMLAENREVAELWMKGRSGNELNAAEFERFDHLCTDYIWLWATIYERNQLLDNPRSAAGNVSAMQRFLETYPGMRPCWNRQRQAMVGTGPEFESFFESVESRITSSQQ